MKLKIMLGIVVLILLSSFTFADLTDNIEGYFNLDSDATDSTETAAISTKVNSTYTLVDTISSDITGRIQVNDALGEDLKNASIIAQSDLDHIEDMGNAHASLNFYFDEWWLLSYIIMFLATIFVSYYSREENLFSFLSTLFFGTMVFLFILGIVTQINDYLLQDIFYKMLPSIEGSMPMFEFYMEHTGIISFIHLLICIFVNRLYLKINEFARKTDIVTDTEVL